MRVNIPSGEILSGDFPPRAQRFVQEWVELHKEELLVNWKLAEQRKPLNKIEPLE